MTSHPGQPNAVRTTPPPDGERRLPVDGPLDLRRTLGLHAHGRHDPAVRFEVSGSCWRATRTPDGPGTELLELVDGGSGLRVRAWGPGAAWLVERAGSLAGLDDEPDPVIPRHPAVADAVRRLRGTRIGWTGAVLEALLPAILEQKVTGAEAGHAYGGIMRTLGEPAPGPQGLLVPPAAEMLAATPYHAFHPLGLERRRAELLRAVAQEAVRLERVGAAAAGPAATPGARSAAYAALRAFPGIGPWTVAEVGMRAFGDPDAVSVGDFHLPSMVAWALAGEPRGTDDRMLELLEPYRGQRGRVVRLLELAGAEAPRRGPRLSPRRIDGI